MATYPLTAIRTLALEVQGLTTRLGGEQAPTPDAIYDVVDRLGCVQIDTLQMVHRSHYLALWSRLGRYDITDLDRLIYGRAAPVRILAARGKYPPPERIPLSAAAHAPARRGQSSLPSSGTMGRDGIAGGAGSRPSARCPSGLTPPSRRGTRPAGACSCARCVRRGCAGSAG